MHLVRGLHLLDQGQASEVKLGVGKVLKTDFVQVGIQILLWSRGGKVGQCRVVRESLDKDGRVGCIQSTEGL